MLLAGYDLPEVLKTDVLVIGSGLAGLLAALRLSQAGVSVVLACKGALEDSNTTYAQGGLAASLPTNQFDSPELHLEDTIKSGSGLVDQAAAQTIIFSGNQLIDELIRLGVAFDCDNTGALSLAREGGHCRSRILHNKDATGRSITAALVSSLKDRAVGEQGKQASVIILEHAFALSLLLGEERCLGAKFALADKTISVFASRTILATGGLGQIYARTTNPPITTGDGIAAAYRAGAALVDMEFVQFHPTVLAKKGAPAFLISEAVRGAGAILLDSNGDRFMRRFHEDGELATRDVVARAIHSIMNEQSQWHVYLDLRTINRRQLLLQFPNIIKTLRQFGIDPISQPIPVSPAAHYFMGGIITDIDGNTSIAGLSAIGECAAVGLHGANRLASNSLLEAGVMAIRTSNHLLKKGRLGGPILARPDKYPQGNAPHLMPDGLPELRAQMYKNVGLIRDEGSLNKMLTFLSKQQPTNEHQSRLTVEASNMNLLARLITQSALLRRESRGAHFRSDFPQSDDRSFRKRLMVCRTEYSWLMRETSDWGSSQPPSRKLAAASS